MDVVNPARPVRRHRWSIIVVASTLLLVGAAAEYQRGRDATQDQLQREVTSARALDEVARISACIRGNQIRRGQRLDNQFAIDGLRHAASDPAASARERKRWQAQIRARVELRPVLARFPCGILRQQPNATKKPAKGVGQ